MERSIETTNIKGFSVSLLQDEICYIIKVVTPTGELLYAKFIGAYASQLHNPLVFERKKFYHLLLIKDGIKDAELTFQVVCEYFALGGTITEYYTSICRIAHCAQNKYFPNYKNKTPEFINFTNG